MRTLTHMKTPCTISTTAAATLWAASALAQQDPNIGMGFVTVGAPGNRATLPSETPFRPDMSVGSVPYGFRITKTEVRTSDYFEFIQGYLQTHPSENRFDSRITGSWIVPSGASGVAYDPQTAHWPIDPSWRMAARFCNWLHNDRVNEAWAFNSGAYDTSTFTETILPDGQRVYNDQATRSPGARFWIPSEDEAMKAFFYDPNRYGTGQEGYWTFTNASLTAPVVGRPENGGTTNVGQYFGSDLWNAGSYPNAQSPWGLLDTSGGLREWTEQRDVFNGNRLVIGTTYADEGLLDWADRLDGYTYESTFPPTNSSRGFRVAGAVPSPGVIGLIGVCVTLLNRRRRHA